MRAKKTRFRLLNFYEDWAEIKFCPKSRGMLFPEEQLLHAFVQKERQQRHQPEQLRRGQQQLKALHDGQDRQTFRERIERLRQLAEREGNDALWRRLEAMDPETAKRIHPNNVGRVIRAIEVMTVSGKSIREHEAESLREPCPYHVIELGLRYHDRETLYGRINRRVDKMVEMGLTEEVKAAREQGLTATAAQAIGCKELYSWLDGKETQEEALEKLKQSTRRYAKRQLTWFGTDQRMRWIEPDTLAAGETPLDKAMEILEKEGMA